MEISLLTKNIISYTKVIAIIYLWYQIRGCGVITHGNGNWLGDPSGFNGNYLW